MKKAVRLGAVLALAVGLAACGGDDDSSDDGAQDTVADEPADTVEDGTSEQPDETDAAGVGSDSEPAETDPIVIGWTGPLTGPAAAYGGAMGEMLTIYVDQINDDGGIAGRQVELIQKDDAGDPSRAIKNVEELLLSDGIDVMLGPVTSSPALAVLPTLTEAKVLQIAGITNLTEANNPETYPYFFNMYFDSSMSARVVTEYFINDLGLTKIAMLSETTASGQGYADVAKQVLDENGLEAVALEEYNVGDTDFSAQIASIERSGAEGVLLWGNAPDQHRALLQMVTQGLDLPVGGHNGLAVKAGIEIVGQENMGNVVCPFPGTFVRTGGEISPEAQEVIDTMRAAQGESFAIPAQGLTRDQIFIVKHAIEAADGSTDADDLKEVLESTSGLMLSLGEYAWTPDNHQGFVQSNMVLARCGTLDDNQTLEAAD